MTFTSPVDRPVLDRICGERNASSQQLDYHRATLLHKLEALDDKALSRPMTASGVSLIGLVKHLGETERGWFIEIFAASPGLVGGSLGNGRRN